MKRVRKEIPWFWFGRQKRVSLEALREKINGAAAPDTAHRLDKLERDMAAMDEFIAGKVMPRIGALDGDEP